MMEYASSKAYVPKKKKATKAKAFNSIEEEEDELYGLNLMSSSSHKEKIIIPHPPPESKHAILVPHKKDLTNIVSIQLGQLESETGIATGLPILCKQCSGVLSQVSKPFIQKNEKETIWTCEYCGTKNNIQVEDEESINQKIITYILGGSIMNEIKKNEEEVKGINPLDEDISVIFCIDISGSMDTAKYVKDAQPMKYAKNKNYPSRLECVKMAIDSQIQQMSKEFPNRKIGFVFFEDVVSVYGDCSHSPKIYKDNMLNNFDGLIESIGAQSSMYFSLPVKKSASQLLQNLGKILTGGSTALGPGLVGALGLALQGKKGSQIIICTDGLANKGLGSVDSEKQEHIQGSIEFYNKIGKIAKDKGIQISIITLVEAECKLSMLSPIADLTGGSILRVNPMNLSNDFSHLIAEAIVATKVNVEVRLHKALKFFKEEEQNYVTDNKNIIKKEIGNVTRNSIMTFEYGIKSDEELNLLNNFDIHSLKFIPLQSVITYESMKGMKCLRVITESIETTEQEEEIKQNRKAEVIAAHGMQVTSNLARKGLYKKAEEEADLLMDELGTEAQKSKIQKNVAPLVAAIKHQNLKPAAQDMAPYDDLSSAMNQANLFI